MFYTFNPFFTIKFIRAEQGFTAHKTYNLCTTVLYIRSPVSMSNSRINRQTCNMTNITFLSQYDIPGDTGLPTWCGNSINKLGWLADFKKPYGIYLQYIIN